MDDIDEEEVMMMYADAECGNHNDVIEIKDDPLDNECEQAIIESELFDIDKKISVLMDRKDILLSRKHALEEQKAADSRNKLRISNEVKINKVSDPKQEKILTQAALKYFNINTFRPLQMETMLTILKGEDCILIMPTGGGKSLTFQLPSIVRGGVTIVVSPLISLMEDQVTGLKKQGIEVVMVTGRMDQSEQSRILKQMPDKSSPLRLLYVTPEKISKAKRFQSAMEQCYEAGNLSAIVIDEVHCVSQWGHDFRTDYKILNTMKRQYPGTPILGLTATASSKVLADVQSCLRIPQCKVLRASFNRPNLHYEVVPKGGTMTLVCEQISIMIKGRFAGQSGLIYCYSRNDCESVMGCLSKYNLKVAYYHASLPMSERSRVHQAWLNNKIQCIVATVAFGMGIDKPDVRFIIHHNMSKSIDNYYQESGRAGRDGKDSKCVLLFQLSDYFRISTMVASDISGLSNANEMLGYCITGKCRRATLGDYFGETFSKQDCGKTCDRCNKADFVSQNITPHALNIIAIIEKSAMKKKDLTYAMLMTEWKSSQSGKLSSQMRESVVASLLCQSILVEKFKTGMYKLISYLQPGSRARAVKVGSFIVSMDVPLSCTSMFKTPESVTPSPVQNRTQGKPTHSVLTNPSTKVSSKKRKAVLQFDDSD